MKECINNLDEGETLAKRQLGRTKKRNNDILTSGSS
jgi:hypothetical protein